MPRAILFCVVIMIFGQAGFAQQTEMNHSARLIGWWEEYSPSSNFIHFSQDGMVRLMLKKGEIGDLHSLDGTWTMSNDGVIQMVFSANGREVTRSGRIEFVESEMVLIDENGAKTKHNRHSGELPEQYVW